MGGCPFIKIVFDFFSSEVCSFTHEDHVPVWAFFFVFFGADVFLSSNSLSWLVYRQTIDFSMLTLYSATLLQFLIRYRIFLSIIWDQQLPEAGVMGGERERNEYVEHRGFLRQWNYSVYSNYGYVSLYVKTLRTYDSEWFLILTMDVNISVLVHQLQQIYHTNTRCR